MKALLCQLLLDTVPSQLYSGCVQYHNALLGSSQFGPRQDTTSKAPKARISRLISISGGVNHVVSLPCRVFHMEEGGLDSEGKTYTSRREMWEEEAGEDAPGNQEKNFAKKMNWYQKGVSYWEGVEASVDGVLGGYGNVNARDIVDSASFLLEMFSECLPGAVCGVRHGPEVVCATRHLVALDCGAGVGRVTKNLLLHHFNEVDLVEPVRHFLDAAQCDLCSDTTSLGSPESASSNVHKAVNFYCTSLQEFTPEVGRYDVIWVQWCIGHLTDHDFVAFFKRAQVGLKPDGFFIIKENIAKTGFVVDKLDNSVTRSDAYFQDLFKQTGLHLHKSRV